MAYVDKPTPETTAEIQRLSVKLIEASQGEDAGLTAMAALHVALAIWNGGEVTQEQARKVTLQAIEACIDTREN